MGRCPILKSCAWMMKNWAEWASEHAQITKKAVACQRREYHSKGGAIWA